MLAEVTAETALTTELGHQPHQLRTSFNSRKRYSGKSITNDVPRNCEISFDLQLVRKHQTRFQSMGDKVLSLYVKGMTRREMYADFKEMYEGSITNPSIEND
ncbi:transposase (fragment) [Vibrio nigripulchritudo Wn13]|uniref:transposase n=1 Tax=Vibrio nigripulchritudo TaxID=28173 RepID=UPI0003B2248F